MSVSGVSREGFTNHQPLRFNATRHQFTLSLVTLLFSPASQLLLLYRRQFSSVHQSTTTTTTTLRPASGELDADGRGGAVGIGVGRPCGERGGELRGVHGARRGGGAIVRGVQGGGLHAGGGVAAVLLLVVVDGGGGGGVGEDRRVGARRVQGGQHAVVDQAAPGGHLRHALHAPVRARRRRVGDDTVALLPARRRRRQGAASHHGHGALRHRADAAWQDRRRRRRQAAQAVPVAEVVRLPLHQLQPGRRRPPLRPRRGAARRRGDGGGRAVHPRVHLVVGVLDGDGAPEREPRGPRAAAAVRRRPPRLRPEPQAGRLAVHAPGARGDDRALRHRAARRQVVPHCRPLPRLHPRARPRRQVPRRRPLPHARRAGKLS